MTRRSSNNKGKTVACEHCGRADYDVVPLGVGPFVWLHYACRAAYFEGRREAA